jgi:hypothetical protein
VKHVVSRRALDIVRPQLLAGAVLRPLNFAVRSRSAFQV